MNSRKIIQTIITVLFAATCIYYRLPAVSWLLGLASALVAKDAINRDMCHKVSSYTLKAAIIFIGFGVNLHQSLSASMDGIIFTIFSVVLVMVLGVVLGRLLKVDRDTRYLIASGTAICGGSAIAAVAPTIKAKPSSTSISLAVIFILNALAMLTFPHFGRMLGMTQEQFGMWAAIAIHDTSAVVGAAQEYGEQALEIATVVKLSRALWIIPLSLISAWLFRDKNQGGAKISIPWFILIFIGAMAVNTIFIIDANVAKLLKFSADFLLNVSLFLIGATLSLKMMKEVGNRAVILGIILWVAISVISLIIIRNCLSL